MKIKEYKPKKVLGASVETKTGTAIAATFWIMVMPNEGVGS